MDAIGDIAGYIGMVSFLGAYFLLQKGRIAHTGLCYLGLNVTGSLLLLFSLLIHWNLPVFLLEAAWAMISIQGIVTHVVLPRRRARADNHDLGR